MNTSINTPFIDQSIGILTVGSNPFASPSFFSMNKSNQWADLAKPSNGLSTNQLNVVCRIVECVTLFLKDSITSYVKAAAGRSLLVSRQGDGTWMKSKQTFRYDGNSALGLS